MSVPGPILNTLTVLVFIAIVTFCILGLTRKRSGSRLIEIAVILSLIVLAIGIILPALGAARRTARSAQRSNQLRGIHMALILQSKTNNGWYPGLDNAGNILEPSIEARFKLLLDNNHFASQYAISPAEFKTVWTSGPFSTANYSYSMLQLPAAGARHDEWRSTNNANAPALSDRLIPHGSGFKSVHTNPKQPNATEWRGSIAWNDNHVSFEPDFTVDTQYVKTRTPNDNLFQPTSNHDAWMIYSGNGEAEGARP